MDEPPVNRLHVRDLRNTELWNNQSFIYTQSNVFHLVQQFSFGAVVVIEMIFVQFTKAPSTNEALVGKRLVVASTIASLAITFEAVLIMQPGSPRGDIEEWV